METVITIVNVLCVISLAYTALAVLAVLFELSYPGKCSLVGAAALQIMLSSIATKACIFGRQEFSILAIYSTLFMIALTLIWTGVSNDWLLFWSHATIIVVNLVIGFASEKVLANHEEYKELVELFTQK